MHPPMRLTNSTAITTPIPLTGISIFHSLQMVFAEVKPKKKGRLFLAYGVAGLRAGKQKKRDILRCSGYIHRPLLACLLPRLNSYGTVVIDPFRHCAGWLLRFLVYEPIRPQAG